MSGFERSPRHGPPKGPGSASAWSILATALLALLPALHIFADSVTQLEDEIPIARDYTASLLIGADIYTFGAHFSDGSNGTDILKYSPAAGDNATNVADLPFGVHSISAIYNGSAVFVFGGDGDESKKRIVVYWPTNNTSMVVAHFDTGRSFTSAVWTGDYAYIFGGVGDPVGGETYRDEVVRFDTTTFEWEVVLHDELFRRAATSAVWDGTHAYIFAGQHCPRPAQPGEFVDCDDIVRYTPSNNTVTVMGAKFPSRRAGTAATWDGLAAYLVGTAGGTTEIWRYRPATDNLTQMSASLPSTRRWTNVVWNTTFAYVLTGSGEPTWPKPILQYNLTPGKPASLNASSDDHNSLEIRLNWTPPAANTYTSPITNYTLYRGPSGLPLNKVIPLGNVTSHTDRDNLTGGVTYCYKATATNALGEGPPFPPIAAPEVCALAYPCNPAFQDCIP